MGREEVPEGTETHIVVRIAIPVVDIDSVVIAVADYDAIAIGIQKICLLSSIYTGNRALLPPKADYMLFFLNFIWEQPDILGTSPPKASKKFNLYL